MRLFLLLLLLQLLSAAEACSWHKSVSCRDEIVLTRSNYTRAVDWDADPALRYEYQFTQTDTGLFIKLQAIWRVLKSETFEIPLTSFEVSLFDLTDNRLIEIRSVSITSPIGGIRKLADTVQLFTDFKASLDFGHEYEIELRFLPLGINGSFKTVVSIPPFPASGDCEMDSPLALDKDKYLFFVNVRKYPFTSTASLSFYTAPRVFCFSEYTIEVFETSNPLAVYAKAILPTTASTHVLTHEFPDLPVGIHLSIKIYPTEAIHARQTQCICRNCNCLVTQTKSFKFTAPEPKESPPQLAPSITAEESSFFSRNLPHFIIICWFLLLLLMAIIAICTCSLRKALKPQRENVKLISEWSRDEKMPMVVSGPELRRNGAIWVIGLNSVEEHRFLYKLSSHLHPSTRLIFAPDDLPDGESRWKWLNAVNRGVDSIILLLRSPSLSLYSAGLSPVSDPFETIFIEQINLLHPSDHRIITVSLDGCKPSLFNSSLIVYQDPRDFPLLTQSLYHRGFPLVEPVSIPSSPTSPLPPSIPQSPAPSGEILLPLSPAHSLIIGSDSIPLQLRTERSVSEIDSGIGLRSEMRSDSHSSSEGDSGYLSIPSSPENSGEHISPFPYPSAPEIHVTLPADNFVVANG